MPEASSPLPVRQCLPFTEFLPVLFQAFADGGVKYCILRNYEGLPATNVGNDVDLLIHRRDLPRSICILRSLDNIRLVNYTDMNVFVSVYLEGASVTPGSRSLQVDLFFSIASKGPEYLSADAILHAARQHQSDGLQFLVPSPAHEAIVSLCAHLVYGGFLKEKYFSKVQRTFVSDRFEVLAALQPAFGIKAGTRLLDAVTEGDRRKILDCIRPLRLALNLRCLLRKPLRGTMATARYYASIFKLRYSPRNLETVCFVGPDCYDKMAIIDRLTPMLHSAAKVVNKCQFRSQLPFAQKTTEFNSSTGPQAGTSWSSLSSVIKVAQWLLEGWKIQLFGRRELTLRIFERFYHDLLIEPKSYGYSGPMWFARFVGRLFPSPDLWILLDPAGGGSQSRNGEVISTETLRQLEAYRSFVKTRKRYVILDASTPIANVTEEAYAAVIEMLAQRTDSRLRSRFPSLQRKAAN